MSIKIFGPTKINLITVISNIQLVGLAQWDKRRPVERKAVGSNPGRINTQGL